MIDPARLRLRRAVTTRASLAIAVALLLSALACALTPPAASAAPGFVPLAGAPLGLGAEGEEWPTPVLHQRQAYVAHVARTFFRRLLVVDRVVDGLTADARWQRVGEPLNINLSAWAREPRMLSIVDPRTRQAVLYVTWIESDRLMIATLEEDRRGARWRRVEGPPLRSETRVTLSALRGRPVVVYTNVAREPAVAVFDGARFLASRGPIAGGPEQEARPGQIRELLGPDATVTGAATFRDALYLVYYERVAGGQAFRWEYARLDLRDDGVMTGDAFRITPEIVTERPDGMIVMDDRGGRPRMVWAEGGRLRIATFDDEGDIDASPAIAVDDSAVLVAAARLGEGIGVVAAVDDDRSSRLVLYWIGGTRAAPALVRSEAIPGVDPSWPALIANATGEPIVTLEDRGVAVALRYVRPGS